MSNALAIASVTAVLKDLLDNALIDRQVSTTVGAPVTVTALPPDRIDLGEKEVAQLNLFLYHVAPNTGWRNAGLPSATPRGERATNPPLGLDLFYLLTAYGKLDFEAEILLGYAMQMLHETPILTRDAIRKSLAPTSPVGGGILPPALGALSATDLADQVELVKLSMQPLSMEEIYKMWGAFQVNYRPSVAYQASVVLIEGRHPARDSLPVLMRGAADQGITVQSDPTPPPPPFATLTGVEFPNKQLSARAGDTLTLKGFNLLGDIVQVIFKNSRLAAPIPLTPNAGGTASQLTVTLPDDPANWVAGLYTLNVVVSHAGEPDEVTNDLSFALAPRILTLVPNPAPRDGNGRVTFTLTCKPQVRPSQTASLFVGAREILAQPHTSQTDTLTFQVDAAPPGQHVVRLRIDGVDSQFINFTITPPAFDNSQKVTIT